MGNIECCVRKSPYEEINSKEEIYIRETIKLYYKKVVSNEKLYKLMKKYFSIYLLDIDGLPLEWIKEENYNLFIASFFETLFSVKGYDTLQTRQWIWQKSALAISNSNVVTGDGFGLFGELLFNYNINDWATRAINETRSAHSGYIQYLGEGGILMLALFIVFVGYISYLYFKNMKNNRDLLVISLSFFVFSLIYMIIESGAIIFAKSIEYGGAAVLIFVPLLTVNKEAKEKSN